MKKFYINIYLLLIKYLLINQHIEGCMRMTWNSVKCKSERIPWLMQN